MDNRYSLLLSPVKVGSRTLKNRMIGGKCAPHHTSFEEDLGFFTRFARAGASTVIIELGDYPGRELEFLPDGRPARQTNGIDMNDPAARAQMKHLIDAIHAENTLVSFSLMGIEPGYLGIADTPDFDSYPADGDYSQLLFNKPGATTEFLDKMLDEFVYRCLDVQSLGADMCTVYMSYRGSILATSLSPCYNQRTDQYGGKTMRERAALTKDLFTRIRKACGPDFLIEAQVSGEEEFPGYTMEDFVDYCEEIQDLVDIIQIRGYDGSETHVSGHNTIPHAYRQLRFAEAVKARKLNVLVAPIGGFFDPDDMEQILRDNRTDLFSMARRFISDPEFAAQLEAGCPEDVVPCLMCNECHGRGDCSVNPRAAYYETYPAPAAYKKVAVLGGGPAGMEAALTAARRGHTVTLYEKGHRLGGQLNAAGYPSFKWPVRDYRDYMIHQLRKAGVTVLLSHAPTPAEIQSLGYDAVLCAFGSAPQSIPVQGADAACVRLAEDVFGHETSIGRRVVVIGGGTTGRETAIHLAQYGKRVTLVTRRQMLFFHDNHAQRIEEQVFRSLRDLDYLDHAATLEIGDGYVVLDVKRGIPYVPMGFRAMGMSAMGFVTDDKPEDVFSRIPANAGMLRYDESHMTHETVRLACDTVVISGGRTPRTACSDAFAGCAPEVISIGDNLRSGYIKNAVRSGYEAAMKL